MKITVTITTETKEKKRTESATCETMDGLSMEIIPREDQIRNDCKTAELFARSLFESINPQSFIEFNPAGTAA